MQETSSAGYAPVTAKAAARIEAIEENFLCHPAVDGFFVHGGTTDAWAERHAVERLDRYWRAPVAEHSPALVGG